MKRILSIFATIVFTISLLLVAPYIGKACSMELSGAYIFDKTITEQNFVSISILQNETILPCSIDHFCTMMDQGLKCCHNDSNGCFKSTCQASLSFFFKSSFFLLLEATANKDPLPIYTTLTSFFFSDGPYRPPTLAA